MRSGMGCDCYLYLEVFTAREFGRQERRYPNVDEYLSGVGAAALLELASAVVGTGSYARPWARFE